jgi:predicted transcriptional regulator
MNTAEARPSCIVAIRKCENEIEAAMTDAKLISDDLLRQIEDTARAQNRKPAEVIEDAVKRYLDKQSWVEFVARNERRTREMGITEADVPRLVEEVRRENRENSR